MASPRVVPLAGTAADDRAASHQDPRPPVSTTLTFVGAPDAFDALTPRSEILAQLKHRHIWLDARATVVHMLRDSALGGITGWIVGLIFTYGNVFSGQSAQDQSYAMYCSGVMGGMSLFCAICDGFVQAASMVRLHFVDRPDRHPTLGECLRRLLRKTWYVFVVAIAATEAVAYGMASLPGKTHTLKLHFYVGAVVVYLQTVHLDLAYRRTFQLETTEGQARGVRKPSSYCHQFTRLMIKDLLLFVLVYVAAVYVHVSVAMRLESTSSLLIFSLSSYLFKLCIQEATKTVMLHQKKTNAKSIYVAVATPTVLIDTQIRVVNLRQSSVSQSIAGTVAISVVEVVFRFMKVWLIRLEIYIREKKTIERIKRKEIHAGGGEIPLTATRNPAATAAECDQVVAFSSPAQTFDIRGDKDYLEFLQWRRRLLRFHAAEIHADMYAEYLAIVCSMAIYFFFHDHPKYAWTATGSASSSSAPDSSSVTSASLDWQGQAVYLVVQLVMEMVIDALSCVWELSNGVPMHNSKQMRAFLAALFVCAAMTNLVLSAALTIKSSDEAS